jgi:hypothetical protein
VKRTLTILALAAAALGCEPDARNDANLFLDRVQRIDLDDPVEERQRLVGSLASLPLEAESVQRARDACVEAHRTILEAEALHARARSAVEAHGEESAIAVPERQRIERDIQRSNRAIARSRELFARCHRLTRDLELRYRSRRGGE